MKQNHLRPYGILGALLFAWSLTACTPTILKRGNAPDQDALATIEPGVQTHEDVAETIGSPSVRATFDDRTWYYISERVQKKTFRDPQVISRKIIAVDFDEKGIVQNIYQYDLRNGRVVGMISRKTPTPGKKPSAIEEMFGGIENIFK